MKKILALAVWIAALGLYAHPATTGWIYSRRTRSLWKRCPFRSESPLVKPLKSAARLVREGRYDGARYTIRYFQPDGRGELRMDDGTVFLPNDRYPLDREVFRLYYTSRSDDQQTIDVYVEDNTGQVVKTSFTFQSENGTEETER